MATRRAETATLRDMAVGWVWAWVCGSSRRQGGGHVYKTGHIDSSFSALITCFKLSHVHFLSFHTEFWSVLHLLSCEGWHGLLLITFATENMPHKVAWPV
jgi:hypothetical protein